jgi:small subunit ribosomal protein S20
MAYKKSAKKAIRTAERRRVFNLRSKKAMKEAVKDVEKLVTGKDLKAAAAALPKAYKAVDKAVKKGVIKAATAARMKSRVARSASSK